MRRAAKIDANHNDIADYLRGLGWSVFSTAALGRGFPDLLVGCPGFACVVEVKDGSKPPSARKLTDDERDFARKWKGPYLIATSPMQANDELMALVREHRK